MKPLSNLGGHGLTRVIAVAFARLMPIALSISLSDGRALAQEKERVEIPFTFGAKAVSMGGAFVAIADDSTGGLWNPAGLAFSPYLRAGFHTGWNDLESSDGIERLSASGFTAGWAFMGFHYQSLRLSSAHPNGRDADAFDSSAAWGLELDRVGVSVLQSLPADNLVVGVNLHYLSSDGRESPLPASTKSASGLDELLFQGGLPSVKQGHFDMDVGVLYEREALRIGLSISHLFEPEVAFPTRTRVLARRARAGIAWTRREWQLAFDVDVSRSEDRARELGFGVERSLFEKRLSLRGGVGGVATSNDGELSSSFSFGVGAVVRRLVFDLAVRKAFDSKISMNGVWFTVAVGR